MEYHVANPPAEIYRPIRSGAANAIELIAAFFFADRCGVSSSDGPLSILSTEFVATKGSSASACQHFRRNKVFENR